MNRRQWVLDIMEQKGLTQRDVAAEAGISRQYLCDVIRGYRTPSGKVALRLARVLGVEMSRFYDTA
jgi:transcriptional regulator with XRE-family HTH domain